MKVKIPEDIPVRIYELRDPRDLTCSPHYIGITIKQLDHRLSGHLISSSLRSRTHKNNWIKSLLKDGVKPTIHLIEEVIGWSYACKVEQYYIKEFKDQGYNITNSTEGGEGSVGIIVRPETLEKLRKNSSGENNPMYGKSGELSPMWGKKHSEETKIKMRASTKLFFKNKEKPDNFGITRDIKRDRWVTALNVSGIKYGTGTYGKKEDAEKVINEIYSRRYEETPITDIEIKEIILRHTSIEWCRKLLTKPPSVIYKPESSKWMARISDSKGRHHLGMFCTKEEGEIAYRTRANELVMNILDKYNIKLEDI